MFNQTTNSPTKTIKKNLFLFLKIGISFGLIYWLFDKIAFSTVYKHLQSFDPIYLLPLVGLGLMGIFISVWKWSLLLNQAHQPHKFTFLLTLFWTGLFFNNFLPGRTGGDLVKVYGLTKKIKNASLATLSVLLDRALNLIALIAIGTSSFLWVRPKEFLQLNITIPPTIVLWATLIIVPVTISLLFFPKLKKWIHLQLNNLKVFGTSPTHLVFIFGLALIYQATMIFIHVIASLGLGQQIEILNFFYLIPLTAIVTLLPISLNGIGLREGSFAILFTQMGVAPAESAIAISLTVTVFTMALSLVGGGIHLASTRNWNLDHETPPISQIPG